VLYICNEADDSDNQILLFKQWADDDSTSWAYEQYGLRMEKHSHRAIGKVLDQMGTFRISFLVLSTR
jgi:hypothetical protein